MDRDELQRLRDVAAKATPGPWKACGNNERLRQRSKGRSPGCCGLVWSEASDWTVANTDTSSEAEGVKREIKGVVADAEYIAAFDPPTVTALLDTLEEAWKAAEIAEKRYLARAFGEFTGKPEEMMAAIVDDHGRAVKRAQAAEAHLDHVREDVARLRDALPPSSHLRLLADWFDFDDKQRKDGWSRGTDVQRDLRSWADAIDAATAPEDTGRGSE